MQNRKKSGQNTTDFNVIHTKDPIGPDNNYWLKKLHKEAELTIGAWGNYGNLLNRGEEIINLIDNLYCLKITKEGHPSHPLYLHSKLKPIIFKQS